MVLRLLRGAQQQWGATACTAGCAVNLLRARSIFLSSASVILATMPMPDGVHGVVGVEASWDARGCGLPREVLSVGPRVLKAGPGGLAHTRSIGILGMVHLGLSSAACGLARTRSIGILGMAHLGDGTTARGPAWPSAAKTGIPEALLGLCCGAHSKPSLELLFLMPPRCATGGKSLSVKFTLLPSFSVSDSCSLEAS